MDIDSLTNKVQQLEERITKIENLFSKSDKNSESDNPMKKVSIKEFILLKNPPSVVIKTLTIAYYLEKEQGMLAFNVEDINRYFRLAKEPVPQNLNDQINQNIRKGYIMEAEEKKDSKKAWVITNSGEHFVENNFKSK